MHIPTQAAVMLLIGRRNPDICSTAALQHPAAQRAAGAAYGFLSALLRLLSRPMAASSPQHGPLGRCRAVLGLAELLLGFLAPTLVLAASESMLFQQYHRRWQQQQQQQEEQQRAELRVKELGAVHQCWEGEAIGEPSCSSSSWNDGSGSSSSSGGGGSTAAGPPSAVMGSAIAEQPAPAAGTAPCLQPSSGLAEQCYLGLLGWMGKEPEEQAMSGLSYSLLLLASAWQAVTLLTPA